MEGDNDKTQLSLYVTLDWYIILIQIYILLCSLTIIVIIVSDNI